MAANFIDNFQAALTSAYVAGGGSLVLNNVTGLPNGACDFYLQILAEGINTTEIFHVTNVNAGTFTLTVTGAQANTTASNHGIGAVAKAGILTAAVINQLVAGSPTLQNSPARTIGTVFQNTDTKPRFIAVTILDATPTNGNLTALTDAANPPVTQVAGMTQSSGNALADFMFIFFIVLPNNFYKVTVNNAGGKSISSWIEWV